MSIIIKSGASATTANVTSGNALLVDSSATTQPVSGTVAVSSISGTVPVSGTFWQATQPVSGTVAATQSGTWTVTSSSSANVGAPTVVQKSHQNITSGGTTSATVSLTLSNTAHNSIVVLIAGNTATSGSNTFTVSDTLGNTYYQAAQGNQGVFSAAIYYAYNIASGSNTISVLDTFGVTGGAVTIEVYEVSGFLSVTASPLDATATGSAASSATATSAAAAPRLPNELAFCAVASNNNSSYTFAPGAGWTLDYGQPVNNSPNLQAMSQTLIHNSAFTGSGTYSGAVLNAVAVATFCNVATAIEGSVTLAAGATVAVTNTGTFAVQAGVPALGQALAASSLPVVLTAAQLTTLTPPAVFIGVVTNAGTFADQSTLQPATSGGLSVYDSSVTTAVTVKSSAGQLYGYHILNTTSAVAYIQVFTAGSVTLGTTAPNFVLGLPANGGATYNTDIGIPFGTSLIIAATTTRAGSTTAACECTLFFK